MAILPAALVLAPLAAIPLALLLNERRRMRRALAEQAGILESAFSGAASGMALLDPSGRCLRVNRALCEMMGYPEAGLLHRPIRELMYPDDRVEAEAQLKRLVSGEVRSYQHQRRYVHRSGHLFWALVSNSLVRDEKGKPLYCVAHFQEFTEFRKEFDALAQRDREYARLQEHAKVASWEWDLLTDEIRWSERVYGAFGANPETFEPRLETYLNLVHPEDRALIMSAITKARTEHLPFALDQRIIRPDGEARIVHVTGEVTVGPHGEAVLMHGTAQDVTESREALDVVFRQAEAYREVGEVLKRRNAEISQAIAERDQELLARDQMFRRIVEHVPAAIAYLDPHGACQWMSPEARAHFGIPAEGVSRLTQADFPLLRAIAADFEAILASGQEHRQDSVPVIRRDGDEERLTYWDLCLVPCLDAEGAPEGMLMLAREVTDRLEKERLQERQIRDLEASEALKDRFLGTLSHEMRSPLTVILGSALLFQGESLGPLTEKQHVYVAKLIRNGRELLRLLNNVLEANLLRSGRFTLVPERLAMAELVREVLDESHASAALKGQHLLLELDDELPRLLADRRRMTQVWQNLVANALQHASEGGAIVLRAWREEAQLCCEVFSPGAQIPRERLEGLFTAWEDAGGESKGLGLGLGLSKAIVEAHGGSLGVESRPEGVTVRFDLPLGDSATDS